MFNSCTYIVFGSASTNPFVAGQYRALMQSCGESNQPISINTWTNENGVEAVRNSLLHLEYPKFKADDNIYSSAMLLSSRELSRQMPFPEKSIVGVSVASHAAFGIEVVRKSSLSNGSLVRLGEVQHMGKTTGQSVLLDLQSLSSHTFIAGTNGSGKSNTVFKIIEELLRLKLPFMVIEPAKGEYKNLFGNDPNVTVYGTNPAKTKILNNTLRSAFSGAFGLLFKKGVGIIEKTYNKDKIAANFDIRNYTVDRKSSRREIKKLKSSAAKADLVNMSVTAVEGIGLGALGIGLPDIAVFLGMILKGIYEVALNYGYDYNKTSEKYLILKMMSAALSKDNDRVIRDSEVDGMLTVEYETGEEGLKSQIDTVSELFAADMLVLKFIQGFPVVGIIGGAYNPVYYNKIMNYVRLKYHKRYLLRKLEELKTI